MFSAVPTCTKVKCCVGTAKSIFIIGDVCVSRRFRLDSEFCPFCIPMTKFQPVQRNGFIVIVMIVSPFFASR